MPIVPFDPNPHLAQRPLPTPYSNVPTDRGGQAVGQGLQQLGAGTSMLGAELAKERERANQLRVLDVENIAARDVGKKLWDGKDGFMLKRDGDALETAGVHQEIATIIADGRKALTDEQRELYDRRMALRANGWAEEVERHSGTQRKSWWQSSMSGTFDLATSAVSRAPGDEKVLKAQLDLLDGPLAASLQGAPPERISSERAKLRADLLSRSLDGLLSSGAATAAKSFFDAHKDELGQHAATAERAVRDAERRVTVETKAGQVLDGARIDKDHPWINGRQADEAVDAAQVDPETKRELRSHVRQQVAQNLERRAQAAADKHNEAMSILEQNGYNLGDPRLAQFRTYLLDPVNDGTKLWRNLRELAESEAEKKLARIQKRTGGERDFRQTQAYVLAAVDMVDNKDAYRAMRPQDFSARMAEFGIADAKSLRALGDDFARLRGQAPTSTFTLPAVALESLFIEGRGRKVFPDKKSNPAEWDPEKAQVFMAVRDRVTALAEAESKKGKEPTAEQYSAWARIAFDEVKVPGTLWGTNRTTRAEAMTKGQSYQPVIAPRDLAQIDRALETMKLPINDENRAYVHELVRSQATGGRLADEPQHPTPPDMPKVPEPAPRETAAEQYLRELSKRDDNVATWLRKQLPAELMDQLGEEDLAVAEQAVRRALERAEWPPRVDESDLPWEKARERRQVGVTRDRDGNEYPRFDTTTTYRMKGAR